MVDIIIEGGIVVTMDGSHRIIADGAIAIDDGMIIEVGPRSTVAKLHKADCILDARDKAVIPGFVNVHMHSSEKLVPGLIDDLDLYPWLQKVINPMMMNMTEEDCYWSSLLAQLEMIKSGITCFSDLFSSPVECLLEKLVSSVEASGMRAVLAREIFTKDSLPNELAVSVSDDIDEKMTADTIRQIKRGKDRSGRAAVRFGLGGVSYASRSLMSRVRALANELDVGIHVHVAECVEELRYLKREKNTTPVRYAHEVGLLGPDVLCAHCVWVDSEEIRLLAETGTKVAYNPVSNMKLADGVAPIWRMLEKGITVGLGTDGPASNDNLDMFACMKMGAYLQKVYSLNPAYLPSEKTLEMATIDGARALQMEDQIGSIELGKKADLTVINLKAPNMTPVNDVVKRIVCSCVPSNVDIVVIDGNVVLEGGRYPKLDELGTVKEAKRRAAKLIERMYG